MLSSHMTLPYQKYLRLQHIYDDVPGKISQLGIMHRSHLSRMQCVSAYNMWLENLSSEGQKCYPI